jgi:hypothetical protein
LGLMAAAGVLVASRATKRHAGDDPEHRLTENEQGE